MSNKLKKLKNVNIRFIILISFILIIFPLLLMTHFNSSKQGYGVISILFVILSILPFLMIYEMKKPSPRQYLPIVVMVALASVSRVLFAPIPFFKPTSAIIIITASVFGCEAGFLTGVLSAITSNLFFGQGPWTPWQMFSWGIIGFLSGYLINKKIINNKFKLYLFGLSSGFIFGWIMNIWTASSFIYDVSIKSFLALYISSFVPDLIHGVATVIFLHVLYDSWRAKLNRIKYKFGIINIK